MSGGESLYPKAPGWERWTSLEEASQRMDRAELESELRHFRARAADEHVRAAAIRNAALEEAAKLADAAAKDADERADRWIARLVDDMARAKAQESRGLAELAASIRALRTEVPR